MTVIVLINNYFLFVNFFACFYKQGVSPETQTKIIQTLVFMIIMYGSKSWTVKEVGKKKKLIHLKCEAGGMLCRYSALPERGTSGF